MLDFLSGFLCTVRDRGRGARQTSPWSPRAGNPLPSAQPLGKGHLLWSGFSTTGVSSSSP